MLRFLSSLSFLFFFFNDPAPTEIYPLPLHAALPICASASRAQHPSPAPWTDRRLRGTPRTRASTRTAGTSPPSRSPRRTGPDGLLLRRSPPWHQRCGVAIHRPRRRFRLVLGRAAHQLGQTPRVAQDLSVGSTSRRRPRGSRLAGGSDHDRPPHPGARPVRPRTRNAGCRASIHRRGATPDQRLCPTRPPDHPRGMLETRLRPPPAPRHHRVARRAPPLPPLPQRRPRPHRTLD